MRIYPTEIPLLKACTSFIVGIIAFEVISIPAAVIIYALLLMWIMTIGYHHFGHRIRFMHIISYAVLFMFVCLGYLCASAHDPMQSPRHVTHHHEQFSSVFATIESIQSNSKRTKLIVRFQQYFHNESSSISGKGFIYVHRDTVNYQINDLIFVEGKWSRIQPPINPGQFNFARYSARKNIYVQTFTDSQNISLVKSNSKSDMRNLGADFRDRCQRALELHITDSSAVSLSKAITLGLKRDISKEQMQTFQKTGTAHILAVSGLHVGIVYSLFLPLLNAIRSRYQIIRRGKTLIPLLGVWAFVWICGLPPSAVRAAIMFSFFIIGHLFNARAKSLNLLAASALCMLISDPQLLFNIGFQFSYLAMIGIICVYPAISTIFISQFRVLRYIWNAVSISIAAQSMLIILSIYYFHYTTPFFWLHSVTAILFAYVMLCSSLLLIAFDMIIPDLANLIGSFIEIIYQLFHNGMELGSKLPMAYVENLPMPQAQMAILYVAVAFAVWFFNVRLKFYGYVSLVIFILSASISLGLQHKRCVNDHMILFHYKNDFIALFVHRNKGYVVSDTNAEIIQSKNIISGYVNKTGIKVIGYFSINDQLRDSNLICIDDHYIQFKGTTFYINRFHKDPLIRPDYEFILAKAVDTSANYSDKELFVYGTGKQAVVKYTNIQNNRISPVKIEL